jgi:arylsulfatase A-like enzyme
MKRALRHTCAAAAGSLAAAFFTSCGAPSRPPDVILVTLDTTRADRLGVYGYERALTPSLDRLARDSVTFERAWSTSSWTLPAHASIVTGRRPSSHGAVEGLAKDHAPLDSETSPEFLTALLPHPLDESATTLAELLAAKGYATAAFIGGPYLLPRFGVLQGYEHRDVALPADGKRRADALTDATIAWLERVPRERPVHLLVNYFDPHAPYAPPPGYDDLPNARQPLRSPDLEVVAGAELSPEERSAYVDRYDGEIRFMDFHLGRLLAALARLGRFDGALVIAVGDHGELLGEHGLMQHGHALYEDLIHVPLIIHFPKGRDRGRVRGDTVSTIDLLPLVASELGLTLPAEVEGVPLGERTVAFAELGRAAHFVLRHGAAFDRDLQAVVRWPWKLIASDSGAFEVHRLDRDPGETEDLRSAAETQELRKSLEAERATLRPRTPGARRAELTPDVLEQLRALGYLPR